ncbi:MAG: S8 family serine peptidase, partial [Planctomycetota bacterium]
MKRTASIFSIGCTLALTGAAFAANSSVGFESDKIQNLDPKAAVGGSIDVIIGFNQQPTREFAEAILAQYGGTVEWVYNIIPSVSATLPVDQLDALAANGAIRVIEGDGEVRAFDEYADAWGVERIGAEFAHLAGNLGGGVKVAVIDTGIDYNHPDLAGIYAGGYDFVNNDPDAMDDNRHGTHVAGTVAAALDGVGVVGVAPEIELYGVKVLSAGGSGDWSDIIAGIDWCVTNDMDVTNMSLGGYGNPGQQVEDALIAADEAGVLNIAASGNFFGLFGVAFPAKYDVVMAVSATERDNSIAGFADTGRQIELAAPGVDILSTRRGGGYEQLSGTSMASPHAAGVAALVFAAGVEDTNNNGRINDEVRDRLHKSAIDMADFGRDNRYGFGIVNASTAISEPMGLTTTELVRGQQATFTATGATPGETVYFVVGSGGRPTTVAVLNVVAAIQNPVVAGSAVADADGVATLT